ncbi:oligosaccharide flippase family protein [Sporosarcina sp. FSL K6-2383]|uniref:oligosaccharide flippase family protein n=1 Tax=Sporosarcina sp. FSL K6-2383 TaxID=2921556 RepID=UPI003159DEF7
MTDKKRLFENFSALAIMQMLNYILPFVTLPYLVRVLGMEGYGTFIFSQAFILYFIIIVDFGFELSATREVSLNRDNPNKLSEIVSAVLGVKIILAVGSLIVLLLLLATVPQLREYWAFHLLSFGMVIGNMLFSLFFYQGIEKMKFITIFSASAKIFFTVSIFIFVKDTSQLLLVPIFNSLGYLVVGVVSLFVMITKFKVRIRFPKKDTLVLQAKNSAQFFWSRIAVSMYTTSNTVIIGLVLGPVAAGIFGSADKLFRGVVSLYQPLNNILYPYIAYSKNIKLYKKVFKFATIINIFIVVVAFVVSDIVVQVIFGSGFEESALLLRIFLITTVFLMPSILLGYPLLGAMGYTGEVNKSVIIASVFHIVILLISIPFLSVIHVTLYVLITELIVFLYRLYYVKKFKLLSE